MSYVLTFAAPQHHRDFEKKCRAALAGQGLHPQGFTALHDGVAYDAILPEKPLKPAIAALRDALACDIFVQAHSPAAPRRKKLLLADMDSTMVEEETLDELAAHAGLKDRIAAITARSMAGELDFKSALRERVGMLAGLPLSALEATARRVTYMRGGDVLIRTMRAHGARCVLVSGGFTFFTGKVAAHLGFDADFGNELLFDGDALSGKVREPIQDRGFKRDTLLAQAGTLGVDLAATIAVGDGANDLDMLALAGLGIGYHPKPLLVEALDNIVVHGDLTALLYAQGYTQAEISF